MRKKTNEWLTWSVSVLVLFALTSCEFNAETGKAFTSRTKVKSVVSKCIDEEMDTILPYLDEETQITISSGSMTGSDIVTKALNEANGEDYVNFCYAVEKTVITQNTDYLLESAKEILPQEKYSEVESKLNGISKSMKKGLYSKGLPSGQQEAFYSDLRALVVKTSVLLVAGIVYAIMPTTVIYGKVTAAAALAVGAGVVSGAVMDIYGHYEKGYELHTNIEEMVTSSKTFEEWIETFKEEPEAYYAIATSVITLASSLELNPVVTGIILVVFGAYNVWTTIQEMKKVYNFDA